MLRAYNGRRRRRRVREQVEHVESESSACTDRRKARYQTMDRQIDYTHFVFDGVRVSHVRIRSGDKCVSSQCSRPLCFIQCLTLLLLAPNIIWLDPISLFVCCWCAFFFRILLFFLVFLHHRSVHNWTMLAKVFTLFPRKMHGIRNKHKIIPVPI